MAVGHVFMAMSVDGFIAGPNDELDWLNAAAVEGEDTGFNDFMARVDGLLMGRKTFDVVRGFGEWVYNKPAIILSRHLSGAELDSSLTDKVEIKDLSPQQAMDYAQSLGWKNVYVDGGQLVQAFLNAGLIETLTITQVPIVLGNGKRMFGSMPRSIKLTLQGTKSFPSGLVQTSYKVG
ncbi:dihydrofolate reductase family protein [Polycladidibacter stylochi]|uniref:dihydrofolate reductase family protein n=1 Tax=Polycladidibacter stylochi TaxID=1807766 RepID=UPI00082A5C93|nr:dihydrofolate reductase family protein [Pseudovibrio stylochi]